MIERKARVESEVLTGADKWYHYTATDTSAVQLTVRQLNVRIVNAFAFTLSLPPVSEAKGLIFVISVSSATAAVTLTDFGGTSYNDSINWEGDFTLDAAEDTMTLQSDGKTWHILEEEIAA